MTAQWKDYVENVTTEPAALRAPGRIKATNQRIARESITIGEAAEMLKPLKSGGHLFAITKGQISMIDVVLALIKRCAPADVSVFTWCIADYEIQSFQRLLDDGGIASFRLVIDTSGARMDRPILQDFQDRYGADCIRVTKTHAKIALVSGEGRRYCARGSMNLNANPRMEQMDISEGDGAESLARSVVDELWELSEPLPMRELANHNAVDLFSRVGPEATDDWAANLVTME